MTTSTDVSPITQQLMMSDQSRHHMGVFDSSPYPGLYQSSTTKFNSTKEEAIEVVPIIQAQIAPLGSPTEFADKTLR